MPIEKQSAFVTSDRNVYLTREAAQEREIQILLEPLQPAVDEALSEKISHLLVEKAVELVAILSTRKPRTPKAKLSKSRPAKPNPVQQPS